MGQHQANTKPASRQAQANSRPDKLIKESSTTTAALYHETAIVMALILVQCAHRSDLMTHAARITE
jgi:hypothetical protein